MTNDRSEAAAPTLETPLPEDLVGESRPRQRNRSFQGNQGSRFSNTSRDCANDRSTAETVHRRDRAIGPNGTIKSMSPVTNQATDTTNTLQRTNETVAKKRKFLHKPLLLQQQLTMKWRHQHCSCLIFLPFDQARTGANKSEYGTSGPALSKSDCPTRPNEQHAREKSRCNSFPKN